MAVRTPRKIGTSPVRTSALRVRRLNVTKQGLAGKRHRASKSESILRAVRSATYVQWDPVSVVAPSHQLALWNRVDGYRPADLERVLWREKRLFQYFAHALALVPADDFPLFGSYMRRYPESLSSGWGAWRAHARRWIPAHAVLRARVLAELAKGPRRIGDFEEHVRGRRAAGGWGSASDVSAMLFHLQMSGEVTIVGQNGNQNIWGLTREFFPRWRGASTLSLEKAEEVSAARAIGALGVATPRDIRLYFMRGQYQDLAAALARLEREGIVRRVAIDGWASRDPWYILTEDVPLLESMEADAWVPRTSLLPPFDSLMCLRDRTARLFGFDHFTEMYIPEAKRKWGYYVLPILSGDTFVGRIDPRFDRVHQRLCVRAVHAEPGVAVSKDVAPDVREAIDRLAGFLGAVEVEFPRHVPPQWRKELH